MHKISFTVKDLEGFSFSVGSNKSDGYGTCHYCQQRYRQEELHDEYTGTSAAVTTISVCEKCKNVKFLGFGDDELSMMFAVEKLTPTLCIKLNKEQRVANCPVCGNSNTFNQGPQIYVEGTNDIVCEPCLCHYDDEPGEPTPLQVASKEIYSLWYFTVGDWKRSHKQSK